MDVDRRGITSVAFQRPQIEVVLDEEGDADSQSVEGGGTKRCEGETKGGGQRYRPQSGQRFEGGGDRPAMMHSTVRGGAIVHSSMPVLRAPSVPIETPCVHRPGLAIISPDSSSRVFARATASRVPPPTCSLCMLLSHDVLLCPLRPHDDAR